MYQLAQMSKYWLRKIIRASNVFVNARIGHCNYSNSQFVMKLNELYTNLFQQNHFSPVRIMSAGKCCNRLGKSHTSM